MSEMFSSKKRAELRSEYCLTNGYSYLNDKILNDYTDYLELRLLKALNKANEDKTESEKVLPLLVVSVSFCAVDKNK